MSGEDQEMHGHGLGWRLKQVRSRCSASCGRRRRRARGRRARFGWVSDFSPPDLGERRQAVRQKARDAADVRRSNPAHEQCVGDQRSMAAPRHGFRTHQRQTLLFRQVDQFIDGGVELRCLHVVGVTAERKVSPPLVRRVRRGATQTTETGSVPITDSDRGQRGGQVFPIELRVVSRPRHGANIDHASDAMRFEQSDELRDRPRRVTDGENGGNRSVLIRRATSFSCDRSARFRRRLDRLGFASMRGRSQRSDSRRNGVSSAISP